MLVYVSVPTLLGRNARPSMEFLVIALHLVSNSRRRSCNGKNTKRRQYISGVSGPRCLSRSACQGALGSRSLSLSRERLIIYAVVVWILLYSASAICLMSIKMSFIRVTSL